MIEKLPILEVIPGVKSSLKIHNTLILQAPPGAGKSTVLPLEILNEPWLNGNKILMLEPRRLAARAVANRMADLLEEETGQTVGYRIRFENRTSSKTRIEVLTEGVLTRLLQSDNSLDGVGIVIFDEFHERSLHADLALALCREVQQILRQDLRILIMSATLDGINLVNLLQNPPIINSKGRQYPISHIYAPAEREDPLYKQMSKAIKKAYNSCQGDILAFFPGAADIEKTNSILKDELPMALICPLYGDLPHNKQQQAILPDPRGQRKIVLATSIAETSLTIEGVKVVVDSGFSRVPQFDVRTGLTRLTTVKVTKDTAEQRAGRAGRLGPGISIRLWSEGSHHQLVEHRTPEIFEADLTPMVLELSKWGVQNINDLSWLTSPPAAPVSQAKELLGQLEAIDSLGHITKRGEEMLRLPTHPRIAHLLLESKKGGLLALASDVAALLEERDPLGKDAGCNLTLRVEALRKWRSKENVNADRNSLERVERVAASWRKTFNIPVDNSFPIDEQVGKLIAYAYPERIAKQREQNNRYRLAHGKPVKLDDHDPLSHNEWLAVAHMDAGQNEGKIYLAAPLNPEDVMHLAKESNEISWDTRTGILIARKELRLGDIIIKTTPLNNISESEKARVLCEAIKEDQSLLPWTEDIEQIQNRITSLKIWRPEEDLPDISRRYLLETIDVWLSSYLTNVKKKEDFQRLDLLGIIETLIPWEIKQKLEVLVPSKIRVPSGSMISLSYNNNGSAPILAVRLQEMFGLLDTPRINEGRTQVLLHLLSPGYKPVQVTQDLQSFWKNIYPEVRKELRVRYKRHFWPEDPWTAEAMRGARKRE